ncbi:hypothetical protein GHK92_08435 [Nocardioides sp. dk4132]|uniref:hypothetical protein n=1 Tax=unclassified Nocardioides TaxID=2615069 RepID=UPI001295A986|nr:MULTISPECIES: hypothetical protein [unclassified Nocardioides]MQW75898.1 hypothetical protein [Nocardioides sp. dk4132]
MTWIDEPLLKEIEAELGEDGVWVAPDLRAEISPAQEARLEAAVAEAATPTYVTLVELDHDDLTGGSPEQLAAMIRDDTGRSGFYVVPETRIDDEPYRLEIVSYPDDAGLFTASAVAQAEHPKDLGAQTLRALELLESGDADRLYDELNGTGTGTGSGTGTVPTPAAPADDSGGPGVTGVLTAVLVVAVAVVIGVRRRRPRAVPPSAAGSPFTLPPAVLSTVRAAEDRRNEDSAHADVLALGEAIDAAHLDPRHAASLPAWQAALDHYDVARRILDREHSPADAVGAIVLAGRGRSALEAAVRGRGWTPEPGCYFHPLHNGPVAPARWHDGDATTRVPACTGCTRALEAGDEPADVLDFVADGRPAHYFRLDLGPWSSTGYGSLDPDLLGRLTARG